jgi:hypothetical protein
MPSVTRKPANNGSDMSFDLKRLDHDALECFLYVDY